MEIDKDLRTGRFWRRFAVNSFSGIGLFSVVVVLLDIFFPKIITESGVWLAASIVLVSIVYGGVHAWPQPIVETYSSPNTQIRLIKADLFDQPGHLVIGMSDTFDTRIPDIIAKNSIQGQFLDRIFDGNIAELDQQLKAALSHLRPVGHIEKEGNKDKYEVGTVAVLKEHARRFFCVAYTEMNGNNEARGTVDGIWRSLDRLWQEVRAKANGGSVFIPVIGGGQSRLSQILPAQDSIRFMILSFMFASRHEKVCDELVIVVQPKDYERLDRLEIQSFLRSLWPS
jgi:hypothetical protein